MVSTDFATLLDHAIASLIVWHKLQVLCLRVLPTGQYEVHLPTAWTTFGQWNIDPDNMQVLDLSFTPRPKLPLDGVLELLARALELIEHQAERDGITGFAFSWVDALYPQISQAPCILTIARVDPFAVARSATVQAFLGNLTSPLRAHLNAPYASDYSDIHFPVGAARSFLSNFGDTELEYSRSWADARTDGRHLADNFIMDRRAVAVDFSLFGILGDTAAELLSRPERLQGVFGGSLKPEVSVRRPMLAMRIIDRLVSSPMPIWMGGEWFWRMGFRLGRLLAYANAWTRSTDPRVRPQLLPLLAWASFDVMAMHDELQALQLDPEEVRPPPVLLLGTTHEAWDRAGALESITDQIAWIMELLVARGSPLIDVFQIAWRDGWRLDRYIALTSHAPDPDPQLEALESKARHWLNQMVDFGQEKGDHERDLVEWMLRQAFPELPEQGQLTAQDIGELDRDAVYRELCRGTVARLCDLAVFPLLNDIPRALPAQYDWRGVRDRIIALRRMGRPAVLAISQDGTFGIELNPDTPMGSLDPELETWCLTRRGTMEVFVLESWAKLSGQNGRQD